MDKREQIARMAQTKEDEILLARVYERITSAAARNIPAATAFLSKREQMLAAELLRGQDFVFFGGPAMAEREVCCYVPEYLDESWLTGDEGPIAAVRAAGLPAMRHRTVTSMARLMRPSRRRNTLYHPRRTLVFRFHDPGLYKPENRSDVVRQTSISSRYGR